MHTQTRTTRNRIIGLLAALIIGALIWTLLGVGFASLAHAEDQPATDVVATEEVTEPLVEPAVEEVPVEEPVAIVEETAPAPQLEVSEPIVEEPTALRVVQDTDFQLALWLITAEAPEIWPGQTLADSVWLEDPSLSALDNSEALACGSRYQVDLYLDDETTTALLAGGVLNGPNNPAEHLANGFVDGNPWKYITTEPCPVVTNVCTQGTGDTSTNLNDLWGNYDTRTAGHSEYVNDALHVWTDDNSDQAKVSEYRAISFPLSQTGTLGIDSTVGPNNHYQYGPGLNLFVTFESGKTGTLVFENVYGQDLWLTGGSNADVKANAPSHTGGNGSDNHGTINEWLAVYPDAVVNGFAYTLGSGVWGDWFINSITVHCATYTFDAIVVPEQPEPRVTTETDTETVCLSDIEQGDEEVTTLVDADGNAVLTTYGRDTTFPTHYDAETNTWPEDEGVVGEWYFISDEIVTVEDCVVTEEPTPTPTPTETTPAPTPSPTIVVVTGNVATPTGNLASTGSDGVQNTLMAVLVLILAGVAGFVVSRIKRERSQQI